MKTLALVLGIIFVVLAILAFTGIASFMPALGVDGTHHMKHGIGYLILAILCFVWMRFQTNAPATR